METGFGPFDTARKALTVTATMRRAATDAATGWRFGEERADAFIVGHPAGEERFGYAANALATYSSCDGLCFQGFRPSALPFAQRCAPCGSMQQAAQERFHHGRLGSHLRN